MSTPIDRGAEVAQLLNALSRRMEAMYPGYFPAAKHNHYADFGYPDCLDFMMLWGMYSRNGIARAAVDKTILKTWQDNPFLLEKPRDQGAQVEETPLESDIRQRFDDLRLWQQIAEADRRSLVGHYSGLILRLADNQPFDQPVTRVPGGLDGLVEVIPAWEGQLRVATWDSDTQSPTYGKPTSFQFNESAVGQTRQPRQFQIHPDRVLIWSRDGTVNGLSLLEAGYNDLIDMEKIKGAGGEGFWKNAKSAPVLEVDKEARLSEMARIMGVTDAELVDKLNDQVGDWQKGFDKLLMLQGINAKTLNITLPSPEHFFDIALQSFAASVNIPTKILVGMQTGERASTEDAKEWAQTNMARRTNIVKPNIMALVRRLEAFGIIAPDKDWTLDWTDLTEASIAEKIDRADKMAGVNQKMQPSGELVFTPDEIRAVVDKEPLAESEKYLNEAAPEDEAAAAGADPQGN